MELLGKAGGRAGAVSGILAGTGEVTLEGGPENWWICRPASPGQEVRETDVNPGLGLLCQCGLLPESMHGAHRPRALLHGGCVPREDIDDKREYFLDLAGPVGVFILKPRTQRAAAILVLRQAADAIQVF